MSPKLKIVKIEHGQTWKDAVSLYRPIEGKPWLVNLLLPTEFDSRFPWEEDAVYTGMYYAYTTFGITYIFHNCSVPPNNFGGRWSYHPRMIKSESFPYNTPSLDPDYLDIESITKECSLVVLK